MTEMIEAMYDGKVFRPTRPIALAPNTRVRMTIESLPPAEREAPSFLSTARALELDGPPDWSDNIGEQMNEPALLTEAALGEDWLKLEEDEAWAQLHSDRL